MNIRIESIGSVMHDTGDKADSMGLLEVASKECIEKSKYISHDIDLLIYTGVYRTDFLLEPAIAAILAMQLDLNAKLQDTRRTLAFDVMNGGLGFFNACVTAFNYIKSGNAKVVMIATAEIENNKEKSATELVGINESAATVILEGTHDNDGFGDFLLKNFVEEIDERETTLAWKEGSGMSFLDHSISKDSHAKYLDCITKTVSEYMTKNGLTLDDFDVVIPPQMSNDFCQKLEEKLFLKQGQLVNVFEMSATIDDDQDFLTSSLPYALKEAIDSKIIEKGNKVLFINAGSGIQVSCISYQF